MMRILFTSVTDETFGSSNLNTEAKKDRIKKLESYYLAEVILGKAVLTDKTGSMHEYM